MRSTSQLPIRKEVSSNGVEKRPISSLQKSVPSPRKDSLLGYDLGLPFLGIPYFGEIPAEMPGETAGSLEPKARRESSSGESDELTIKDINKPKFDIPAQQGSTWLNTDEETQAFDADVTRTARPRKDNPTIPSIDLLPRSSDSSEDSTLVQSPEEQMECINLVKDYLSTNESFSTTEEIAPSLQPHYKAIEVMIESIGIPKPDRRLLAERQPLIPLAEAQVNFKAKASTSDRVGKIQTSPSTTKVAKDYNLGKGLQEPSLSCVVTQDVRLDLPFQLGSDMSDLYAAIEKRLEIVLNDKDSNAVKSSKNGLPDTHSPDVERSTQSVIVLPDDMNFASVNANSQADDVLANSEAHTSCSAHNFEEALEISLLNPQHSISPDAYSEKTISPNLQPKDGKFLFADVVCKDHVVKSDDQLKVLDAVSDVRNTGGISETDISVHQTIPHLTVHTHPEVVLGKRIENEDDGLLLTKLEYDTQVATQLSPSLLPLPSSADSQEDLINRRTQEAQDKISYIPSIGVKVGNNAYVERDNAISEIASTYTTKVDSAHGQAIPGIQKLKVFGEGPKKQGAAKSSKDTTAKSMDLFQRTYRPDAVTRTRSGQRIHHMPSLSLLSLGSSNKALVGRDIGDAASGGNAQLLLELLSNNPKLIDTRTSKGVSDHPKTALMRAALLGHINCMEILHHKGANLLAVDRRGRTALHLAVAANQISSVKWLLRSFADLSASKAHHGTIDLREMSDADGSKPLHIAAKRNYNDVAERLIIDGANVESLDHFGRTPLHIAVMSGHLEICKLLLEKMACINALDTDQMAPLHWASKIGHVGIIKLLLFKGADRESADCHGYLPLHHTVLSGQPQALACFCCRKQDLEIKTKSGELPIHLACLKSHLQNIEFLLQNGAQVNAWTTPPPARPGTKGLFSRSLQRGNPIQSSPLVASIPLHIACQAGHYEGADLLLREGAWVNASQEEGKTPLMLAAESGNTQLVSLILHNGATVNAKTAGLCETALHISCKRADLETAKVLIQNGADIFATTSGDSSIKPLDYALGIPPKEISLDKRDAIIEYMKQTHIQINMAGPVKARLSSPSYGEAPDISPRTAPWSQAPGRAHRLPQLPQSSPFNMQEFSQYFDSATSSQPSMVPFPTPAPNGANLPLKYG